MKATCLFLIPTAILLLFSANASSKEKIDYCSPENILRFADYLNDEGDYLRAVGEYERYLFLLSSVSDRVLFKIGQCYCFAGNTEKAIGVLSKVRADDLRFPASYLIAYLYFHSNQYDKSNRFIVQALGETVDAEKRRKLKLLMGYNYLHLRRWHDAQHVLSSLEFESPELSRKASILKAKATEAEDLPRKHAALAALFSAVVPGAGKVYCGQYGDGFYSFLLSGLTGFMAWDGFKDGGLHSVSGWFWAGACGILYAGNVYGSAVAARVRNRYQETRLLRSLPVVPEQ